MNKKDYFIILLLTLISPLLTGYYFGVLDHDHYLPYLNRLLNPVLYFGDYFFSQPHGLYSWFNNFIVFIKQIVGLDLAWTHLFLYLFSLYIFYLAVYSLAKTFYRRSEIAVLAVLFLMLPKWASQIGYMTHHFYFVSRDLSLGLSLLAFNYLLLKRINLSIFWLILAFIVNPSIPIPIFILLPFYYKNINLAILPLDSSWFNIMQKRGTYSFPLLWHWTGWGTLIFYFSLLGISWLILAEKIFGHFNYLIKKFILICLGLFILHLIISSILPVPELIQFQLLRAINFIFILSLITMAGAISLCLKSNNLYLKISAIISGFSLYFWSDHLTIWHILLVWLLPLVYFIIKRKKIIFSNNHLPVILSALILLTHLIIRLLIIKPVINLPQYWYYPNPLVDLSQYQEWRKVQLWAKINTDINAVFLVPPNWSGFRSFSERGIVADAKDGGVIFYSSKYAQNWQERMNLLVNYENFSQADFTQLNQLYPFDYLVVTNDHQLLSLELVYQNQQFSIYKM